MTSTAWLFPGQGSQQVGMAQQLYEDNSGVRELFAEASERTGLDIVHLCFEGPADALQRTEYAQPCLLTASIAYGRALEARGLTPDVVAGHSLGEYSALVQAGVLTFGDAAYAVHRRGRLMAEAKSGAMAAILGLDDAAVERACADAVDVVPANYNAPGQVVISGSPEGVSRASAAARELGATRVVLLKVSGAFHSPFMRPVALELARTLSTLHFAAARMPVICNVDGAKHIAAEDFPPLLARQVAEPVRWSAVMQGLLSEGVSHCVEVGPGRVLSGLMRQMDRSVASVSAASLL
ncbi:MAG TPA: ACP S-malonyltransferase [Chloroflexota bacterium]|nr:ACP S-malonyltransferase [Chloroflexota bacterium]